MRYYLNRIYVAITFILLLAILVLMAVKMNAEFDWFVVLWIIGYGYLLPLHLRYCILAWSYRPTLEITDEAIYDYASYLKLNWQDVESYSVGTNSLVIYIRLSDQPVVLPACPLILRYSYYLKYHYFKRRTLSIAIGLFNGKRSIMKQLELHDIASQAGA